MSLPIINGSTALSSANLHLLVWGDGKSNMAICGYRINWVSGTTFQVVASVGSIDTIGDVSATWDAGNSWVDVDWSGVDFSGVAAAGLAFNTAPIMVVSAAPGTSGNPAMVPQAKTETVSTGHIMFVDGGTGNQNGTPAATFDCYMLLFGEIA